MGEIAELHGCLIANLRLGMSVFLNDDPRDALKLIEEKSRFRELEGKYADNHLARLTFNATESIETSSLHLDLISELKHINALICDIAYPILDSTGPLTAVTPHPAKPSSAAANKPSQADVEQTDERQYRSPI